MNIIRLNTWGGRGGRESLLGFFEAHRDTTDIFCLQEVWSSEYADLHGVAAGGRPLDHSAVMTHALQEISEILPEHTAYFRTSFRENYGLCTFVRNALPVVEEGEVFVHKHKGYEPEGDLGKHARNIQFVTIETPAGLRTVINFHGLWNGQGKGDSEDRLLQSERIIDFTKTLTNPFILMGDFNLTPNTESLKRFEHEGLRNLIMEYGITSTRTSLYAKQERYADYAFVSEGVAVENFMVLPDEVSDHAPLVLSVQ